jgi:hypothetical protein
MVELAALGRGELGTAPCSQVCLDTTRCMAAPPAPGARECCALHLYIPRSGEGPQA